MQGSALNKSSISNQVLIEYLNHKSLITPKLSLIFIYVPISNN